MFSFFKKPDPLKQKIEDIKKEMEGIVQGISEEKIKVFSIGAFHINPVHLAFWIRVKTDNTKHKLESNTELLNRLRKLLVKYDYPIESKDLIHIRIESEETVNRESNGNWMNHLQ